jgi:MFS family permease
MDQQISVANVSRSKSSRVAMLVILSLTYGSQYLDMILLGLVIQPIKAEFALSDTQAGLLTGVAFTALFVMLGVPLARLADRTNRKRIVLASVAIFSIATICCGLTVGFLSLFAVRMMVAVGEAGSVPASISMLADAFPPEERRLALSFHSCGAYFGTAIGLLFVALISPVMNWRHIFGIAGAFGLILATLIAVLVREPARLGSAAAPRTFFQDVVRLARVKPFVYLALALGVVSISSSAAINWVPAYLARSHGMSQQYIILYLAAAWGIAATSGGVASGILTNWLHRKGGKWPLIAVGTLMVLFPAMCCAAFLAKDVAVTLLVFGVALFLMGGVRGPTFAAVQDIVPASCRATANSFLMFSMYAIGITFGPLMTGVVSDLLQASLGAEALRYALLIVISSAAIIGAVLVALAASTIGSVNVEEAALS